MYLLLRELVFIESEFVKKYSINRPVGGGVASG